MIVPDNELFRINVMGTYNVIEAAVKLGIRKIVIASSETTYGVVFADEPRDPRSLPLEEDYDVDPMDSYALSKVVNERTAHAFALRSGFDIYALRIGNVIEPHEYEALVPSWKSNPSCRKKLTWSYIDARDLGQIVKLCVEKDGLGYQVFNAANNDSSADLPTKELREALLPEGSGEARDGRIRSAVLQQEDPRGARLQGRAPVAEEPRREIAGETISAATIGASSDDRQPTAADRDRRQMFRGIVLMVVSAALFAVVDALSKILAETQSVAQIVWARYALGLPILLAASPPAEWRGLFRTALPGLQIGRALTPLVISVTMILGVFYLPLAEATVILFAGPFFVVALSAPLLGERVGAASWIGVTVGFAAVLLVARPGLSELSVYALFPLVGAVFFAIIQLITRHLGMAGEKPATTLAWTSWSAASSQRLSSR